MIHQEGESTDICLAKNCSEPPTDNFLLANLLPAKKNHAIQKKAACFFLGILLFTLLTNFSAGQSTTNTTINPELEVLPLGMSSFLYSDYPKHFGIRAKRAEKPEFVFSFEIVNTFVVHTNNEVFFDSQSDGSTVNLKYYFPASKYSVYNVLVSSVSWSRITLPLPINTTLIIEAEYINHSFPYGFDREADTVHGWFNYNDKARNAVGQEQKKNFFLIDQETGKPVFTLDKNKGNSRMANLPIKLQWQYAATPQFYGAAFIGTNMAETYLSKVAKCGQPNLPNCSTDNGKNFFWGLIFDYLPASGVLLNLSVSQSHRKRDFLPNLPNKVTTVQFQTVFRYWLLDWAVVYQTASDLLSTHPERSSEIALSARYHFNNQSVYIGVHEGDFRYSTTHLDYGAILGIKTIF